MAATFRADHGYTEAELEAHFGWTGGYMASRYTRSANRKKLAKDAANKRPESLTCQERVLPAKSASKSKDLQGRNQPLVRSRKVP
jgi:hypothetical protein